MATSFPVATYPLEDKTNFEDDNMVRFSIMSDGTMRSRTLSSNQFRVFKVMFEPMEQDTAEDLTDYLRTNATTEFDLVYDDNTYRGYFIEEFKGSPFEGILIRGSAVFRGVLV